MLPLQNPSRTGTSVHGYDMELNGTIPHAQDWPPSQYTFLTLWSFRGDTAGRGVPSQWTNVYVVDIIGSNDSLASACSDGVRLKLNRSFNLATQNPMGTLS